MRVSVVVPTHGRPELLKRALASIAAQTLPAAEVIVVDDLGDAAGVAAAAAVRYLALPPSDNSGASRSRNAGAAAATGDVLAFLDDDDEWMPGFLAALTARLDGAEAAYCWIREQHEGRSRPVARLRPGLTAARTLGDNPGASGQNFVISRAAFARIGGFDETLPVVNDLDFFTRALDAGVGYAVVPEELVVQHLHDGDRIASRTERRAIGFERYLAKYGDRMTYWQRRRVLRSIHSVRRVTAPTARARWGHAIAQAASYDPRSIWRMVSRLR